MGLNLAGFVNGAASGSQWMMNMQRQKDQMDERKRKQQEEDAAAASTADALQAQLGIRQKVAGLQPTNEAGQEVAGPPAPKFEIVYEPEKERELQIEAIRNIGKAYGPAAAMQLNELFRVRQEHVTRQAAADTLSAIEAGSFGEVPAIFNRTRIGGYMESIEPNGKDSYLIKMKGREPVAVTREQLTNTLAAKTLGIDKMLDREFRERDFKARQDHYAAIEKGQAEDRAERASHQKEMRDIYRENYTARNENAAAATAARVYGTGRRPDDKLYDDAHFKVKTPTGEEAQDYLGQAAAREIHQRFMQMTGDEYKARALTMGAIETARAEAARAYREQKKKDRSEQSFYKELLEQLLSPPASQAAPSAAKGPTLKEQAAKFIADERASASQARQGINPPVKQPSRDPLEGLSDEEARKLRTKLIAERKRYEGRPEAAARVREIDDQIDRIGRHAY